MDLKEQLEKAKDIQLDYETNGYLETDDVDYLVETIEQVICQLEKIKQLSNVEELTLADFAKEVLRITEGKDTPTRNTRE